MVSDQQLTDRLKAGDEEAFTLIYERYASALLHHLICMTGNKESAEEIFHEVFITLIKKINFYEDRSEMKNSFKAWLYRIATNKAIDEIRKTKNIKIEEIIDEVATELGPDESFDLLERSQNIQKLVTKLPLVQRTFLNLKLNDDLTLYEIAQICSCSVNSVKQGLFQARRTLKNLLLAEGIEI